MTPEAALGGPLSRVRRRRPDHRRRRPRRARARRAELALLDRAPDRPRAPRRRVGRHRTRALRRLPRHRRPGRHRRQRLPATPLDPIAPARGGPPVAPARREPARRRPCSTLVPVMPVVVIDDLADAVPLARALVAGGLPAIELTLRTPVALDAIRAIAAEVPEILVGAGTVVTPGQAEAGRSTPGRSSWSRPGATPTLLGGDGRHRACRSCPAPRRSRRCWPCSRPGVHRDEVLPRRGRRRRGLPEVDRLARARRPLLPDRRDHRRPPRRPTSRCPTSAASAARGSPPRTPWPPATGRRSRRSRAPLRRCAESATRGRPQRSGPRRRSITTCSGVSSSRLVTPSRRMVRSICPVRISIIRSTPSRPPAISP